MNLELNQRVQGIVDIIHDFDVSTRVQWSEAASPTGWGQSLFIPTEGYLETSSLGPVLVHTIVWIEIDTIEVRHIGRLVPDKRINHLESLTTALSHAGLSFTQVDNLIHIPINIDRTYAE